MLCPEQTVDEPPGVINGVAGKGKTETAMLLEVLTPQVFVTTQV